VTIKWGVYEFGFFKEIVIFVLWLSKYSGNISYNRSTQYSRTCSNNYILSKGYRIVQNACISISDTKLDEVWPQWRRLWEDISPQPIFKSYMPSLNPTFCEWDGVMAFPHVSLLKRLSMTGNSYPFDIFENFFLVHMHSRWHGNWSEFWTTYIYIIFLYIHICIYTGIIHAN